MSAGMISSMRGAFATICWVMPVIWVIMGGMGRIGLTSELKSLTSRKPSMRTAPISVILLAPARAPVVSRSRATNGTSARVGIGALPMAKGEFVAHRVETEAAVVAHQSREDLLTELQPGRCRRR